MVSAWEWEWVEWGRQTNERNEVNELKSLSAGSGAQNHLEHWVLPLNNSALTESNMWGLEEYLNASDRFYRVRVWMCVPYNMSMVDCNKILLFFFLFGASEKSSCEK